MKRIMDHRLPAVLLILLVAALTGCVAGQPVVVPDSQPTVAPGLANPASVHCADKGGTLDIRSDAAGNQSGFCVFADGSECEEWAYFRGECAPGGQPAATAAPALANPASVYCGENGGTLDIRSDAAGNQSGVCVFADGSECEEWAYFRGECAPGGQPAATAEPEVANPAAAYCVQQGGSDQILTDGSGNRYPACVLPDGTICPEVDFFRGDCGPGQQPAASDVMTATVTAELIQAVQAALPSDAFESLAAIELEALPGDPPLWAVYSTGMRNFDLDPPPGHFVAIYTPVADGWNELARLDISNTTMAGDPVLDIGPDFVYEDGVKQVEIDPSRIWLTVDGGAGAHSGTFQVLSFDGETLRQEIGGASSSPGAGYLADLNGDGQNDVVLNATEYYVFCYACGVRNPYFNVYIWLGDQMLPVEISALMMGQRGTPPDEANSRAVQLAQAALWPDALAAIQEAVTLAGDDDPPTPTGSLRWNAALIQLNHDAQLAYLQDSPYPLLSNVFYGDYAAAVDLMRDLPVEQIFAPDTPLVVGTVAEGWQAELSSYLVQSASAALDVMPHLAPAYFVRAWGAYLADPTSSQIAADLAAAALLEPADPLFAAAAQALPIAGQ